MNTSQLRPFMLLKKLNPSTFERAEKRNKIFPKNFDVLLFRKIPSHFIDAKELNTETDKGKIRDDLLATAFCLHLDFKESEENTYYFKRAYLSLTMIIHSDTKNRRVRVRVRVKYQYTCTSSNISKFTYQNVLLLLDRLFQQHQKNRVSTASFRNARMFFKECSNPAQISPNTTKNSESSNQSSQAMVNNKFTISDEVRVNKIIKDCLNSIFEKKEYKIEEKNTIYSAH
ncbi:hypothetical protein BpHYR1_029743 [Brachionus plicatilis]|uniref:Uncharacterized protein n=1 Tax=Brachionus plicatilis TaxID=10195 RepID=A0A3M7Q279_BRAPC|nr:hypothetical protein BpHYR1_029743 [Brachionus plicatilis]